MLNSESLDFERFHASESLERLALRDLGRLRTEACTRERQIYALSPPMLTSGCSHRHKP